MVAPNAQLVLVSGITGFVAAEVALAFLREGFNVRGTARDQQKAEAFLEFYPEHRNSGRLQIAIVPDIIAPGAFDDAVKGVDIFVHTASPIPHNARPGNWSDSLLTPAVNGTLEALRSAAKESSVKRVVITSSAVTLFYTPEFFNNGVLSESIWMPVTMEQAEQSTDTFYVYSASKALAERAAWDFMDTQKPQFTLTTLLPPWVYGPPSTPATKGKPFVHGTNQNIYALLDPSTDISLIAGGPNQVDSRDLALAHVRAAIVPEAAGERILVVGDGDSNPDSWLATLKRHFHGKELAPTPVDYQSKVPYKTTDRTKAAKILGINFRPFEDTLVQTAQYYYGMQ